MNQAVYVIVSPVRNEEAYLERTIDSVINQTVTPARWVIVDDGSTDRTGAIAESYSGAVPWIEVVHRPDRGYRLPGGGVIEAFYDGYLRVEKRAWAYIVKLDGDVSFDRRYFETLATYFTAEKALGLAGGDVYNATPRGLEPERQPRFHVRGAVKMYRRSCFEAIGGLARMPGWDTLDEVKANMLGFTTRSFADLYVVQHRPTGAAQGSWRNYVKNGRANWISGYHPLFLIVKCLKRSFAPPFFVASAGIAAGYCAGCLRREPRINDRELIGYLRRQQLRKLLFQASIWK